MAAMTWLSKPHPFPELFWPSISGGLLAGEGDVQGGPLNSLLDEAERGIFLQNNAPPSPPPRLWVGATIGILGWGLRTDTWEPPSPLSMQVGVHAPFQWTVLWARKQTLQGLLYSSGVAEQHSQHLPELLSLLCVCHTCIFKGEEVKDCDWQLMRRGKCFVQQWFFFLGWIKPQWN